MDWIIAMCPNVTTISSQDSRSFNHLNSPTTPHNSTHLIQSAARATRLQQFEMKDRWTVSEMELVYEAMPQIQSLALSIGASYKGVGHLLSTLSRFEDLTSLVLPDASLLLIGFNPPRCDTVYTGSEGSMVRQQVLKKRRQAEARVATLVSAKLLKLKELWVGDNAKANIARIEAGDQVEISWTYRSRRRPCKEPWDLYMDDL